MTGLALGALILLIFVNGLFVAAEFALVRARRSRIEQFIKDGQSGASRVLHQLDEIDEYLSAAQVGITMASIGIGFLGEPALASLLEPALEGPFSHAVAVPLAFGLAFTIATSLHITVGEQVPKMFAIAHAERTSRQLGLFLQSFRLITAPFTLGLAAISNMMLRGLGVDPSIRETHTPEDLLAIIRQSQLGGVLDPGEAGMLSGVFHLHEQAAREVMTPIPAVVTVDASETVADGLQRCVSSGHTRLIAIEDDNPDRVRGVVHNNSLARLYMNAGADASVEPAIRDVPIVPEDKPLDDLLAELQKERSSIAVVVDEYGRTMGIVTVEDILEEVVGEIEDETDPRAIAVRTLASGDWYVRGHVSLGDLEDAGINLPVDKSDYNSVGGYVFSQIGRLPKRGDHIEADGYRIRVESVRENRIVAVRIQPRGASDQPPDEDEIPEEFDSDA